VNERLADRHTAAGEVAIEKMRERAAAGVGVHALEAENLFARPGWFGLVPGGRLFDADCLAPPVAAVAV
jgi:hypothetical protein